MKMNKSEEKSFKSFIDKITKEDFLKFTYLEENYYYCTNSYIAFKIPLKHFSNDFLSKIENKDKSRDLFNGIFQKNKNEFISSFSFKNESFLNNTRKMFLFIKRGIYIIDTKNSPKLDLGPLLDCRYLSYLPLNISFEFNSTKDNISMLKFSNESLDIIGYIMPVKYKIDENETLKEKLYDLI